MANLNSLEGLSVDKKRITEIIKEMRDGVKEERYSHGAPISKSLIHLIAGAMILQFPMMSGVLDKTIKGENTETIVENTSKNVENLGEAVEKMTGVIQTLTDGLMAMSSIFGMVLLFMGVHGLKKYADGGDNGTYVVSTSDVDLNKYSLLELLYTYQAFSFNNERKDKNLKKKLEEHLILKTQDKEIGKLRKKDIENYVEYFYDEDLKLERKQLLKGMDEVDTNLLEKGLNIDNIIELELE